MTSRSFRGVGCISVCDLTECTRSQPIVSRRRQESSTMSVASDHRASSTLTGAGSISTSRSSPHPPRSSRTTTPHPSPSLPAMPAARELSPPHHDPHRPPHLAHPEEDLPMNLNVALLLLVLVAESVAPPLSRPRCAVQPTTVGASSTSTADQRSRRRARQGSRRVRGSVADSV